MTKQVNLLSEDLLPGYGPAQLPLFIKVLLLSAVLASGWVYYAWYERQVLLAEELEWVTKSRQELTNLELFQSQHPDLSNQQELQDTNDRLSLQLKVRRSTFSGLANQIENAVEGFTTPLKTLSDYDLNGLWLNKINLQDGKRLFSIEGVARTPELIPQYLEQLGQSKFSGITIEQFTIEKDKTSNLWRFTMSNHKTNAISEPEPIAEGS